MRKDQEIKTILKALEDSPVALYTPVHKDGGFGNSMKVRMIPEDMAEKVREVLFIVIANDRQE